MSQFEKHQVAYREKSTRLGSGQACGNCSHYRNPNGCVLVRGFIGETSGCNRWDGSGRNYPPAAQRMDYRQDPLSPFDSNSRLKRKWPHRQQAMDTGPFGPHPPATRPQYTYGQQVQAPNGRDATVVYNMRQPGGRRLVLIEDPQTGHQWSIPQDEVTPIGAATEIATKGLAKAGLLRGKTVVGGGKRIPLNHILSLGYQVAEKGPEALLGAQVVQQVLAQKPAQTGMGNALGQQGPNPSFDWSDTDSVSASQAEMQTACALFSTNQIQQKFGLLNTQYQQGAGSAQQRQDWEGLQGKFAWLIANYGSACQIARYTTQAWNDLVSYVQTSGDMLWGYIQSVGSNVIQGGIRAGESIRDWTVTTWQDVVVPGATDLAKMAGFAGDPGRAGLGAVHIIGAIAFIVKAALWIWAILAAWNWLSGDGNGDGAQPGADGPGLTPPSGIQCPDGYEYDAAVNRCKPIGWQWDDNKQMFCDPNDPEQCTEGVLPDKSEKAEPCFYAPRKESRFWFGDFQMNTSQPLEMASLGSAGRSMGAAKEWWLTPSIDIPGFNEEWDEAAGSILNGVIWVIIAYMGLQMLGGVMGSIFSIIGSLRK